MKRGIRGHDIRAVGLTDVCKVAQETGIEYLQLVLEKTIDGFNFKIHKLPQFFHKVKGQTLRLPFVFG